MAVVNQKSAPITDMDANVAVNAYKASGDIQTSVGIAAVANGDSIASTFRLVRIPSNARITRAQVFCTAITSAAADFGLYRPVGYGGTVADADFFAAAQTIATASAGINLLGANTATYGPANREKRVWEVLGLTSDPGGYYDVVATLTAAATAAGTVGVEIEFVD